MCRLETGQNFLTLPNPTAKMRKFIVVLVLFSVFYPVFTQQVNKEFNRILVDDQFIRPDGKWKQESNIDNQFLGVEDGFSVWRKNTKAGYFIFPEKNTEYSVYEVQIIFDFDKNSENSNSAGLVLQAQPDGSGAIVIELNKKRQYRIRRAMGNTLVNISGSGEGWLKAKKQITQGRNTLMVRTYDKIYDIYINNEYIRTFTEIEFSKGQIGLYIGAGSRAYFKQLVVKTDDDHANPDLSNNTPIDEQKALAQALVKLKETINKKDKRIAELETQIRTGGGGSRRADSMLMRQAEEASMRAAQLNAELEQQKSENARLKETVERLETFRKNITESENGDVIINLTNMNQRQKEQIEMLQATIRNLEKGQADLKQEKADLTRDLSKARAESDQLRNASLGLQVQMIEKDSILLSQEARIQKTEDALAKCSRHLPKEERPVKEPKKPKRKEKEAVKQEKGLFDE